MRVRLGRLAATCLPLALALVAAVSSAPAAVDSARRGESTEWVGVGGSSLTAVVPSDGTSVRRIVAVDFDRDGDLDVLAATDHGVLLWLNDGHGHLVVQHPNPAPPVPSPTGVEALRNHREDSSESIQNDLPSLRFTSSYAHAPPALTRRVSYTPSTGTLYDASAGSLVPRAPPSLA